MQKTITWFVQRGLLAGAIGGFATALFIRFVTETRIGDALLFEDATGIGLGPGEAPEFTRSTQQWGGMAAAVIFGAVMGIVLGIGVAALHDRIKARDEFGRAAKFAASAFVAVVIIPGLKYPPNPPTVGDPDSISDRTVEYLLLMAMGILIVFGAWWLWEQLTSRGFTGAQRFALGGGATILAITLVWLIWPPSPDAIEPPNSDAAPALVVSDTAPDEVLAGMLDTARATDDEFLRDPSDPSEPLDLESIDDPSDLIGAPVAVSTTKLVPHAYTTIIWQFRMQSFAGLALLWTVIATTFGLLADRRTRDVVPTPNTPEPAAA
jgi:hypothetical protein